MGHTEGGGTLLPRASQAFECAKMSRRRRCPTRLAVVSKATATHLRHVQRVRVRLNIREQREWLKWRGLRRGEREADGSEHWVCCASDEIKGSGARRKRKSCLIGRVDVCPRGDRQRTASFLVEVTRQGRREGTRCRGDLIPPNILKHKGGMDSGPSRQSVRLAPSPRRRVWLVPEAS